MSQGAALNCGSLCPAIISGQHFSGRSGGDFSLVATTDGFGWVNNLNGDELTSGAADEMGLYNIVEHAGQIPSGAGQKPGADPRLLFGSRGLKCDGHPENIRATLASTASNLPPSQYSNVPLSATAVATPGNRGNRFLTINGPAIPSMFGNMFTLSITVSSFTSISIDWTINTIKHPQAVVSGTQVAECSN